MSGFRCRVETSSRGGKLHKVTKGVDQDRCRNLKTFALRPSHPIALLEGIFLIRLSICASVIGGISKDWFPDFDLTNS